MSSNYPELVFDETEDFTADRLNKAMQVLDQRLRSLEPFTPSWEAAVNDLRAVGLSRLNDAILPAYQRIQLLSEMGFLFAGSDTSVTLVFDQSATFTINDETERALFTPTPFLALTRSSTVDDYAIAQLVSYDNDTGQLMVVVKSVTGNPGPHTDWQIGAVAASTIASMAYFTQIDAARAATIAAKDTASANAVQTAADRVQTGADAASANASKIAAAASAVNAATWDPTNYALISYVNGKISDLINGAGPALDTLNELAAALGNDANFSATVSAALGNRIRVDTAAQGLDATQQANARTNLGLANSATLAMATAASIRINTGANPIGVDQAWAATAFVDLGNVAGTVTIDMNLGSRFKMTAVGNITISIANQKSGQPLDISVLQDGAGGRTVSWAGMFVFPDGVAPLVHTGANAWAVMYSGVWNPFGFMMGAGWKIY